MKAYIRAIYLNDNRWLSPKGLIKVELIRSDGLLWWKWIKGSDFGSSNSYGNSFIKCYNKLIELGGLDTIPILPRIMRFEKDISMSSAMPFKETDMDFLSSEDL